jgi:excisionase family DNA binding protein
MAQSNKSDMQALKDMIAKVKAQSYSVAEAAVVLGVTEMRVRNLAREGKLAATKVNGVYVIDRDAVKAYKAAKVLRQRKIDAKKVAREEYEAKIAALTDEIAKLTGDGS